MRSVSRAFSLVLTRPCRTHDNETDIQELCCCPYRLQEVTYCFIVIVFACGTGFGAAIAMPLLALVVPMKILVPGWSVLSVVAGIDILRRDYNKIAWADLMPLMPSCLLGIVLGLAFYKALDSPALARAWSIGGPLRRVFIAGLDAAAARVASASRIHCQAFRADRRGGRHDIRRADEPVLRRVF